ncbi:hypothetical protein CTI14_68795 [Methylobacterium radiotolerans]|nr:hypothetical protein CTI14_68795 [Methylobacterium radiotolerans]
MAMRKTNTDLQQAVNKALAKLMANGTYARLSQSYFGQDVRSPNGSAWPCARPTPTCSRR